MLLKILDLVTRIWLLSAALLSVGGVIILFLDIPEEERFIKEWQFIVFLGVGVLLMILDQVLHDMEKKS